jgi:anthranilate phosphoribosyltransferase
LLDLCVQAELDGYDLLDIVGTGGDGKNTFNISTLACFVVAGAGQKVAKHGNYGASSVSGSSNVMEQLGYRFSADSGKLKTELEEAGICFLHAPFFHPALKRVGPIRKNLRVRTFFNMLGPIVNPAKPASQLIGVYNSEMGRLYNYLLQQDGKHFSIINSLDGYDEISLTDDARIINNEGERILSPASLGYEVVHPHELYGGECVEDAAQLFKEIISGKGSKAQSSVVTANAAMGLYCSGNYTSYEQALEAANESLVSGNAAAVLNKLLSMNI